jgi:hypothetical protein
MYKYFFVTELEAEPRIVAYLFISRLVNLFLGRNPICVLRMAWVSQIFFSTSSIYPRVFHVTEDLVFGHVRVIRASVKVADDSTVHQAHGRREGGPCMV